MPAEPKTYKRKSTQFKPLTAMQEAYCQSYIQTPENQTQAAINAGFSPNTAAVKASLMMRDERIQKTDCRADGRAQQTNARQC